MMISTPPSGRFQTSRTGCHLEASGPGVAELLVDTDVCVDHLTGTRRPLAGSGRHAYSVVTRAKFRALDMWGQAASSEWWTATW